MSRTVCVDFDGVIHRWNGWNGGTFDEPIEGALDGVKALLLNGFEVVVFTTRETKSVEQYLAAHHFPALIVTRVKPLCLVTLDDRVICFGGHWTPELVEQLMAFQPYWEEPQQPLNGTHQPPTQPLNGRQQSAA